MLPLGRRRIQLLGLSPIGPPDVGVLSSGVPSRPTGGVSVEESSDAPTGEWVRYVLAGGLDFPGLRIVGGVGFFGACVDGAGSVPVGLLTDWPGMGAEV